ncbi:hypothetical protein BDZ89DRAFT_1061833 [Hymenopellis radicata]|nr:hypothetical protein BDZ89DRAFT_1061833 [Hymenopellis radicata]
MSGVKWRPIAFTSPTAVLLSHYAKGDPTVRFITHLDRTPVENKIAVFIYHLILKGLLALFVLWRLCSSSTHFMPLFILWGEFVPRRIPPRTWFWSLFHEALDLFIYMCVLPYLRRFVKGEVWRRFMTGFHDVEIVFRKCTQDDRQVDGRALTRQEYARGLAEATCPVLLSQKAGYETSVRWWKVDVEPVYAARDLVDKGLVNMSLWNLSVWIRDANGRWKVRQIWKEYLHPDPMPIMDFLRIGDVFDAHEE